MKRNLAIEKMVTERQSVKSYDETRRIPDELWEQIIDVIQWSPSSLGAEPYTVLVINHKNRELRKELQVALWDQRSVLEADKLVVFLAYNASYVTTRKFWKERRMRYLTEVRGMNKQEADIDAEIFVDAILRYFVDNDVSPDDWADKQTYVALGAAINAAAILGVGSSPVGSIRSLIEPILKKHKLLAANQHVAVVASFGYPRDKSAYAHLGTGKRVRYPKDQKFKTI